MCFTLSIHLMWVFFGFFLFSTHQRRINCEDFRFKLQGGGGGLMKEVEFRMKNDQRGKGDNRDSNVVCKTPETPGTCHSQTKRISTFMKLTHSERADTSSGIISIKMRAVASYRAIHRPYPSFLISGVNVQSKMGALSLSLRLGLHLSVVVLWKIS